MRKNLLIFLLLCLLTMGAQTQLKPRVVILTDIGQPDLEPDDTESLVHLLCYADQLEIEGDTPSFLNVIPNGLHNPEEPMQVGWGGYHIWTMTKDSTTCWHTPTSAPPSTK